MFKVTAGVTGDRCRSAGFRHTSAQRVDYHIDSAEQFYNGKQSDADIDCYGSAHGGISVG